MPSLKEDIHGTRCAGEIAAAPNTACGVGVAYRAKIAGERILSGDVTDAIEASALSFAWDKNHIYSNSWGPWDNGGTVEGPGALCKKAFEDGTQKGRGGLGSIFVFASGNGGSGDNCNFDGYTNSIYTLSVGSIDRHNKMPGYQEPCSAQLAVTYSSNGIDFIVRLSFSSFFFFLNLNFSSSSFFFLQHTTDAKGRCTGRHGGSSAAAPLAAGILALVLSVRPDLTWRDVQGLVAHTAVPFNSNDDSWQPTGAGLAFSHKFGFGKIDAYRTVETAKTWELLGPQVVVTAPVRTVTGGTFSVTRLRLNTDVNEDLLARAFEATPFPETEMEETAEQRSHVTEHGAGAKTQPRHFRVQHVTVTVDITHTRRGDILVWLISPSGTVAVLATERPRDASKDGLKNWTFMTVACWGESALGEWILEVAHTRNSKGSGEILQWSLTLYGEGSSTPFPTIQPSSSFTLPPRVSDDLDFIAYEGSETTEILNLRGRRSEAVLMGTMLGIGTLFMTIFWAMVMRHIRNQSPSPQRK